MALTRSPLRRTGQTARTATLSTYKKIAPVGKRKKAEILATSVIRSQFLADHPNCEVGDVLGSWGHRPEGCRRRAEHIHERQKRSQGGSLTNPANLLSADDFCNGYVENAPTLCGIYGLVVKSFEDPEKVPVRWGKEKG